MKPHSRFAASIVATFALVLTLGALPYVWDEETVTLDQVPQAVRDTILREAGDAQITEIERETKNGKTVYEAEFLRNGQEIEIKVGPDGALLGQKVEMEGDDEDDITIDQVPEAARRALQELAKGAAFTELEREREHGATMYEATWVVNGAEHEAAVTEAGALVKLEETMALDAVPAAVRAAIVQHFGADANVVVEKSMIVIYEAEVKVDGKEREIMVYPTGKIARGDDNGDDDDDKHGDDDDDDGGDEDDDD